MIRRLFPLVIASFLIAVSTVWLKPDTTYPYPTSASPSYVVSGFSRTVSYVVSGFSRTVSAQSSSAQTADAQPFVNQYCVTCHNQRLKPAGLTLATLDRAHSARH